MFRLVSDSESYKTIVFDTIRIFLGSYRWEDLNNDHPYQITITDMPGQISVSIESYLKTETIITTDDNQKKRIIKKLLFQLIQEHYLPGDYDWGILTGIRPTKIVNRMIDQGMSKEQVQKYMIEEYLLSHEKTHLLSDISFKQRTFFPAKDQMYKNISVYLSIPFCPSICSYCTFGSYHYQTYAKELNRYLEVLCREVHETLSFLSDYGMMIDTIYIGGGTPAVLDPAQLHTLLDTMAAYSRPDTVKEYTFEAGRPEVITEEQLFILKNYGVSRISINPQIMNDQILQNINRKHTVDHVLETMQTARLFGFDCINMDLIAGLEDNEQQFLSSLQKVLILRPENITVHSLAYKRKASMTLDPDRLLKETGKKMFATTMQMVKEQGYQPYYLYKQKLTVSGQENIGFSLPGKESLYNIQMIEERQAILGFGLGASSKLINPQDLTLENVFNAKDLSYYYQTISKTIEKKQKYLEKLYRGQQDGHQKTKGDK